MHQRWIALGALALVIAALPARAADFARLRLLVERGNAGAYSVARTLSIDHAGNPDFDYLYGRAALAAGHPDEAIFALQRVLIVRPADDLARLALAQAYARTGEKVSAEHELDIVLAHDPAPNIAKNAADLRSSLKRPLRAAKSRSFVEFGLGYDSNVNAAPSATLLALPPGTVQPLSANIDYYPANLVLDPNYQAKSDGFGRLAFGLNTYQPFASREFAFGNVAGYENANFNESQFDTTLVNFVGGGGIDFGRNRFSLPLYHQEFLVDHRRYRQYDALGLAWTYRLEAASLVSLSGQYGDYSYQDQLPQDTDSGVVALGFSQEFSIASKPRLGGSLYRGTDVAKNPLYSNFGRRYYGVAVEGSYSAFIHQRPYVSVLYQHSNYDGPDPGIPLIRQENFSRIAAGWNWQFQPNWGLRVEANYTENSSNITLYEYHRSQFYISTRHDFR